MERVVVGLSGGVDSSVAAYLLKEDGYDVIGLYMINWHDKTGTLSGDCPWKDDLIFAELVAKKINIPFHTVDFSEQYRQRVVDYMFNEYERGRTPNPDILCNREVKFDLFINKAKELGAQYIATGHYCRKETIEINGKEAYRLLAGSDPSKEQSYFLCQLSQEQISMALFPIGHLHKAEVRNIAAKAGLPTADKKDSQGICFVGKINLPEFLQQKLTAKKGNIIEIHFNNSLYNRYCEVPVSSDPGEDQLEFLSQPIHYTPQDGIIVGQHNGAHFFTIGQRKGLNVGGKEKPLFVIATDIQKNIIYTGQGDEHPGLYRRALFIKEDEIHWIRPDLKLLPGSSKRYLIRIRYRQPLQKGKAFMTNKGMYLIFDNPQRGITAGQFAAWYLDDEMLGSGVIND
ncbi:MAG: tRNA 2-thiouridine(34) synthase MnmA [Bacteroidales bacterium]|nr:tRNA 2-thiouridine(34) synthase MnmA [Bacteroidales bacterium]